jgi:putative ABC transport system substrate-binding protein
MQLAVAVVSEAQQTSGKIPVVGYLTGPPLTADSDRKAAFRQGLRELGYVEGKSIIIEWRSAEGQIDHLPALATDLVRLKVDVIVSSGLGPTRAAKGATTTIPIVLTNEGDPVGTGIIASLARPGGNITGLSTLAPELSGKRLEILKEIIPNLSRVAVFRTSNQPGTARTLEGLDVAAKDLRVQLQYLDVLKPNEIANAFAAANKARSGAGLMMLAGAVANVHRSEITDQAVKSRLPIMYQGRRFVVEGGLVFYGVNLLDLDRRAATYVDKILKGAKPAGLPVEQPIKFEFIVNLKAAKEIGLTIPPNVLVRADRVIK